MEKHTYQAGLIGNCSYLAHVNINTDITWLCWPRFDSAACFAALAYQAPDDEARRLDGCNRCTSRFEPLRRGSRVIRS